MQYVLLVLFLKPQSSLTPLLFLNLYTGSKLISVLSIKFFLLHSYYCSTWLVATSEIWSLLTRLISRSSGSAPFSAPAPLTCSKILATPMIVYTLNSADNSLLDVKNHCRICDNRLRPCIANHAQLRTQRWPHVFCVRNFAWQIYCL